MTSRLRRATLVTMAIAAFTLASCGVSSPDAPSDAARRNETTLPRALDSSDTTVASPDTTEPDGTEPDSPTETTEPSSPGSLPSGVDEDTLRDSFITGFKAAGLDDEQATCLADAYIDKVGIGTGATPDYSQILDLFGECNIDPSDLGGGTPGG